MTCSQPVCKEQHTGAAEPDRDPEKGQRQQVPPAGASQPYKHRFKKQGCVSYLSARCTVLLQHPPP